MNLDGILSWFMGQAWWWISLCLCVSL